MTAIVRVESGGNPLAMNVNGSQHLARQPANKNEAVRWASWLLARGYSVDMGLAQVNSRNLPRLGVSAEQMFEPCDNLNSGARILAENYSDAAQRFGPGKQALHAALSAYNTGNYRSGIANGYVAKVTVAASANYSEAPPLVESAKLRRKAGNDLHLVGGSGSALVMWVKR